MRILITGSSGRVGRAIWSRLAIEHEVIGLDRMPSATADVHSDLTDTTQLRAVLRGVDAVVHVAALHAPHVGLVDEATFLKVNVHATETLARLAADAGASRFVFTSTTALYGAASSQPDRAAWVDEATVPQPRTIYHRTKLDAEQRLRVVSEETVLPVTVLRMSRCFPEPAPIMALYRLHRGVDVRDVADAHAIAATQPFAGFRRCIVSGRTPFLREDVVALANDFGSVVQRRCPAVADAFRRHGWTLPASIDRVYDAAHAQTLLGWQSRYGVDEVLAQLDRRSLEVLPPASHGVPVTPRETAAPGRTF